MSRSPQSTAPYSMHMYTRADWDDHQQRCASSESRADWLLEELFLQTGENLLGEMGLWTCPACKRTAYLIVRTNVETATHRAITPSTTDVAIGRPEGALGAYFTSCKSPGEDFVGHHPACRRLL